MTVFQIILCLKVYHCRKFYTFAVADKYANTGFSIMSDYMKENSTKALTMKLIAEMEEMYEKIKDEL